MKKSLGLIETEGLAAGVEAADAAVKSANVELIGYELTKGGGWTTIKIQGDVGAVKAAVDAARMAAAKVNRVVSTRVIPRPSAGLDVLVHNQDTVGDALSLKGPDTPKPPTPPKGPKKVKEEEKLPTEPDGQKAGKTKETQPAPEPQQESGAGQDAPEPEATVESAKGEGTDSVEAPKEIDNKEKAPVPEAPAELNGVETPEETEEKEKASVPKAPEDDSKAANLDGGETPEEADESADHPETEDGGNAPEQEHKEPVVPKPIKRAASQKGRKGGKRGNKQEPADTE